jgi:hypothetical protein
MVAEASGVLRVHGNERAFRRVEAERSESLAGKELSCYRSVFGRN